LPPDHKSPPAGTATASASASASASPSASASTAAAVRPTLSSWDQKQRALRAAQRAALRFPRTSHPDLLHLQHWKIGDELIGFFTILCAGYVYFYHRSGQHRRIVYALAREYNIQFETTISHYHGTQRLFGSAAVVMSACFYVFRQNLWLWLQLHQSDQAHQTHRFFSVYVPSVSLMDVVCFII
jgi:hypothetical protein